MLRLITYIGISCAAGFLLKLLAHTASPTFNPPYFKVCALIFIFVYLWDEFTGGSRL